jgi:hypothetical protein
LDPPGVGRDPTPADAPPDAGPSAIEVDAAPNAPPLRDAGTDGACTRPLAPGDLAIVELMVTSVAGTGDYGEWIEVESTRDCLLDVRGLHGESPSGAKVNTFDIEDDLWIPPGGTFLIADSADAAVNHSLPAPLVVWSGDRGDVLRNKGGTVTLRMSGALIESVTYPSLKLTIGASIAFPRDCAAQDRSDWGRWQTSVSSWFPGFAGTPNGANTDVHCR